MDAGASKGELQDLNDADFDPSLSGFDPKEIDDLLATPDDDDRANAAPPLPENPVSRAGDLWICGRHRVLCGDATSPEAVAMLLGERKPQLMVTDPQYGIELDSEWRDRAGLNGCADNLEQRAGRCHPDAILVRSRTSMVCPKKECTVVGKARRKYDYLGFTITQVHHGWVQRREI